MALRNMDTTQTHVSSPHQCAGLITTFQCQALLSAVHRLTDDSEDELCWLSDAAPERDASSNPLLCSAGSCAWKDFMLTRHQTSASTEGEMFEGITCSCRVSWIWSYQLLLCFRVRCGSTAALLWTASHRRPPRKGSQSVQSLQ